MFRTFAPAEPDFIPCEIKLLPDELRQQAAATAFDINPTNAPFLHGGCDVLPPEAIALMTSKYWGTGGVKLSVQFLDNPDAETRRLILSHANAWAEFANVSFAETNQQGQVRITRAATGYWSYIGTDILHVQGATMNLQGFTSKTPVSEYKRVVRHEVGHSLGLVHEHARAEIVALLDPAKVYAYFGAPPNGWSKAMIDAQILTPLSEATLMDTPPDVTSIMCYQFAGSVTKSGKAIPGGLDIDPSDGAFAAKIYPKAVAPPPPPPPPPPPAGVSLSLSGPLAAGVYRIVPDAA